MEKTGLARKLASSVVAATAAGLCLVLIIYGVFTTNSVPEWGSDTKDAMVELEQANMERLASEKAEHTGHIFGLTKDALQQLQAFGEQALLLEEGGSGTTMEVDNYLMSYAGLDHQEASDTSHSVWYATGLDPGTSPAEGSSLEGLLNRTALMDVPFRGTQRQELMYLAALDDPSLPDDPDSTAALQAYPAYDMLEAGFTTFNEDCDDRFNTVEANFSISYFDPRCRVWFQDARADSLNGEPIFTDPYVSLGTGVLTITPAAPVYTADGGTLLGVVGIDMDFAPIESSILSLRIMGDEGYAYLLTPTGGQVAAHPLLDVLEGIQNIVDLEPGIDRDEFGLVVARMTEECKGSANYQKSGKTWLVSWEHETVSGSGAGAATDSGGGEGSSSSACPTGGFIAAVTVSEDALLGVFSETESEIRDIVIVASVVVALLMTATVCFTAAVARSVSTTLTRPVNQLVDIVKGLNNLDFSQQDPGVWMLNEINCREVEDLVDAFKSMTTIINFGNQTLESGNLDAAHKNYCNALFLFTKLNNGRGVSIVQNNLGNVCTLQARALVTQAKVAREKNDQVAPNTMRKADGKYEDAVTNFRLAIEHSEMIASEARQAPHAMFPAASTTAPSDTSEQKEEREQKVTPPKSPAHVIDVIEAQQVEGSELEDPDSSASLGLQLANRKFNLALCLAAKATGGDTRDVEAAEEACQLMAECEALAAERNDALGTDRQVEYLLALAALERTRPNRNKQDFEALERADRVITVALSRQATPVLATTAVDAAVTSITPPAVLRQRLLAARGEGMLVAGEHAAAVRYWAEAIVGCGDIMDVGAVTSSLVNLRKRVDYLHADQENQFSAALIRALGCSVGEGKDDGGCSLSDGALVGAIDQAVNKLGRGALLPLGPDADLRVVPDCAGPVEVDLCFVMDCTLSMETWIDQTKQKLFDIIKQTKKEAKNLKLRVAFVGYRDYDGWVKQYEGPYDFHSEEELPELEKKLRDIKAGGGSGFVADIAGGLKHATELSWRSPVRLCILFADAPCHGSIYHNVSDAYPQGCPKGVDPARMIYNLQELGADFYFIRICGETDKMVDVLKAAVPAIAAKDAGEGKEAATKKRRSKFVVHNLQAKENRFLDVVVNSVTVSAGLNLRVEGYS